MKNIEKQCLKMNKALGSFLENIIKRSKKYVTRILKRNDVAEEIVEEIMASKFPNRLKA